MSKTAKKLIEVQSHPPTVSTSSNIRGEIKGKTKYYPKKANKKSVGNPVHRDVIKKAFDKQKEQATLTSAGIDVRKAVDISAAYLQAIYPTANRVQVEETELTDDKKFWHITLSYDSPEPSTGFLLIGMNQRKFKVFKIEMKTGEVLSMKIRELK